MRGLSSSSSFDALGQQQVVHEAVDEHQHADVREQFAQRQRQLGRDARVEHRDVRPVGPHLAQHVGRGRLRDDVEAGQHEQAGDALAQERRAARDHNLGQTEVIVLTAAP